MCSNQMISEEIVAPFIHLSFRGRKVTGKTSADTYLGDALPGHKKTYWLPCLYI